MTWKMPENWAQFDTPKPPNDLIYRYTIHTTVSGGVLSVMTYPVRTDMKVVHPRKLRNHYERMMARRRGRKEQDQ